MKTVRRFLAGRSSAPRFFDCDDRGGPRHLSNDRYAALIPARMSGHSRSLRAVADFDVLARRGAGPQTRARSEIESSSPHELRREAEVQPPLATNAPARGSWRWLAVPRQSNLEGKPSCGQPLATNEPARGRWLGRMDSNHRMSAPKTDALPLGDSPTSAGNGKKRLLNQTFPRELSWDVTNQQAKTIPNIPTSR